MDVFLNKVDPEKFRRTNGLWNDMRLNARSNIGTVSELINQKTFLCKEEWEEYYYEHGRSREYLAQVGQRLHDIASQVFDISLDECIECVRFRVICETWNGIIVREANTVNRLSQMFGDKFLFKKTEGKIDTEYAVDYEMYFDDKLMCGIQIKPNSYLNSNEDYVLEAKKYNEERNGIYSKLFGVSVFTLYSDMSGYITPSTEFEELQKINSQVFS